jgi:hypothetical protein
MAEKGHVHIVVSGFADCPYYQKAVKEAAAYSAKFPDNLSWEKVEVAYNEWPALRIKTLEKLGKGADSHKTCPLVYTSFKNQPKDFIGGSDSLNTFLVTEYTE